MDSRAGELDCLGLHGFSRVAYREWGDPLNPRVVLCLHGLTRNARDFDILCERLAPRFRLLCPDMPGRGDSAWLPHAADYGYPLYLSVTAALIARSGATRVAIVGTSMGGLMGMMLAAQPGTPVSALVINDVGPFIPKAALERLRLYVGRGAPAPSLEAFEARLREICAPFGPLTDAQWAHLARHSSRRDAQGRYVSAYDPAIAGALAEPLQDVLLWPVWDAVRCPVLVLRGADSDLLPADTARLMQQRGPAQCTLAEFAGVGHAPMLMADDQIGAVESFLDARA